MAVSHAEAVAERAWAEAVQIWDAPLTTNDPAIAAALVAIAAELRAARLSRQEALESGGQA